MKYKASLTIDRFRSDTKSNDQYTRLQKALTEYGWKWIGRTMLYYEGAETRPLAMACELLARQLRSLGKFSSLSVSIVGAEDFVTPRKRAAEKRIKDAARLILKKPLPSADTSD